MQEKLGFVPYKQQTRGHVETLVQLVFFSMEATGIAFLVAVWAASVAWTAKDASRRCGQISLRLGAPLLAVLVPFAGAAVYAFARPCEDRADAKARRLRQRLLEAMLVDDDPHCVECSTPLRPEFRCCPTCGESLRKECDCGRLVGIAWTMCPWCTKPLVEDGAAAALSEVA